MAKTPTRNNDVWATQRRVRTSSLGPGSFSQDVFDHRLHGWIGLMRQVLLKDRLRLRRVNYAQLPHSPGVIPWVARAKHSLEDWDSWVSDFVQRFCCWIEYELRLHGGGKRALASPIDPPTQRWRCLADFQLSSQFYRVIPRARMPSVDKVFDLTRGTRLGAEINHRYQLSCQIGSDVRIGLSELQQLSSGVVCGFV